MPKDVSEFSFPAVEDTDEDGIIAVGGDITPNRLFAAYRRGIFPWPHEDLPLLWFCPDPRFVLYPKQIYINASLRKAIRHSTLSVRCDSDFEGVIRRCATRHRPGQPGTWINEQVIEGYLGLHKMGFAHSVEAYEGDRLVGGLYGVAVGGVFFGESMFAEQSDASKIAFVALVADLIKKDFSLIDCQAPTEHLQHFGAINIARHEFLAELNRSIGRSTERVPWSLSFNPHDALDFILQLP